MDPTPAEPPPPAYVSDYDYDRKISDALQRSLTISHQPQPGSSLLEDEEWEEWDEAKFEMAAARARTKPSSEKELLARQDALRSECTSGEVSSSTSPPPTVNGSRGLPASPPIKEQPSWLADAQLTTSAASTSSNNFQPISQVHHLPPEEEDPDEPLPPFAAVGPSLEGPPFEDVVREPRRLPQGADADSPPESPLNSVADSDILPEVPPLPLRSDHRSPYDGPRFTAPRQPTLPPMIRTTPFPNSSQRPPSMRFDPSIAYKKPCALDTLANDKDSKPHVDAYALYKYVSKPSNLASISISYYSSAVSSLMGRPPPPKKRIAPYVKLRLHLSSNRRICINMQSEPRYCREFRHIPPRRCPGCIFPSPSDPSYAASPAFTNAYAQPSLPNARPCIFSQSIPSLFPVPTAAAGLHPISRVCARSTARCPYSLAAIE